MIPPSCAWLQVCNSQLSGLRFFTTVCTVINEIYDNFDFPGVTTCKSNSKVLFPEYELVIETEPDDSAACDKSEKERLDEYKQFVKTNELLGDSDNDKELESLATLGKEALLADKQFKKFKKRVAREPKQVRLLVNR